jgi:hypothetical protein
LGGTTLDVVPTSRYEIDILPVNTINARYAYGEVPILQFAQTSIAELINVSFEDYYYYGVGTPTPTLNLLDIDIPLFTSLPVTVYESETFGNNFTYKLNVNVASQEHREVVIQPVINIPSTFFNDREFIVKVQNSIDATMAFYSIITTAETDTRTVEIDVNLLQNVTVITHARYEIDVVSEQESVVSDFYDFNEVIIRVENFFDATMAFYSIITTAETDIRTVEIDVNLFKSVEPVPLKKYEVSFKPADKYSDYTFEDLAEFSLAMVDDEIIEQNIAWGRSNFISRELNYKDLRILGRYSAEPISEIQDIRINTFFGFDNVKKNIKITGTIDVSGNTVIGTNSAFDSEFLENDPIIIGSDKFTVKNIANSNFMELNVPSLTNYTNISAYREYNV